MHHLSALRLGLLLFFTSCFYVNGLFAQQSSSEVTVCQGVTTPEDWENYIRQNEEVQGITVKVNTSSCNFDTVPHYIATLEAENGNHWYITGAQSVYSPTKDGFQVFVRFIDRPSDEPLVGVRELMNPLNVDGAREIGLVLRWTAICTGDCVTVSEEEEGTTNVKHVDSEEMVNDLFRVSPNPVDDFINITVSSQVDRFTLTSAAGAHIGTYSTTKIDVSRLPAGIYYLKGESGRLSGVTKVVKQ
ncbi:MAG: T9SS type A sorting domain-containing protein [Lewinella sp.]